MATGMRVAFVTQWFPPEVEGVPLWIAEALRDRGFDVGVVTGVPHYPTGVPTPGHRARDWRLDEERGFRVLRVPEYPSHDRSALRRIATFGSFAATSAALASRSIGRADVALVYSSPATAALPAMTAHARWGTPYVLLIQDLWPDSIFATGFLEQGAVRAAAEPAVRSFVDASYRRAAHVCVITPGMRRTLLERGVPDDRITLVHNWVDDDVIRPAEPQGSLRAGLGLPDDAFVALFAGNAGEAQGLGAWVDALASLPDLPQVHLVLLGSGTQREALAQRAADLGIGAQVHRMDPVPPAAVPGHVADADVSIVSLADRRLFEITMPSKVQATLAMGSAIIASCAGDVADVVRAAGAGWVARPEDPSSIADALRAAVAAGPAERAERGRRGQRHYAEHMSRAIGSARLAAVLREAATRTTDAGLLRTDR